MYKHLLLLFVVVVVCAAGPTSLVQPDHVAPAAPEELVPAPPAPAVEQEVSQPQGVAVNVLQVSEVDPKEVIGGVRGARSYTERENEVPGSQFEDNLLNKLNNKCSQRDPSACAMLKLVSYMNRLLKKANIEVADNVEITTTTSYVQMQGPELPRSLSEEPEEAQLTELMADKLMRFVKSRALRLRLLPTTELVFKSEPDAQGNLNFGMAVENVPESEGRGKNKNMGGLMAAMVMKMGMLAALAFKGLALLVGKALLVSKIALLLAVVLGLKKLFSQQKHVTYEVVAQPHHSHAHVEHAEHGHGGGSSGGGHDSYSSGWSRSLGKGDAQNLAYGSYAPQ